MSEFHVMPKEVADAVQEATSKLVVFVGVGVALWSVGKLYVLFLLVLCGWLLNLSSYLVWHWAIAWKYWGLERDLKSALAGASKELREKGILQE